MVWPPLLLLLGKMGEEVNVCLGRERLLEESHNLGSEQLSNFLILAPIPCSTERQTHLLPLCQLPLVMRDPEALSPDGLGCGSVGSAKCL